MSLKIGSLFTGYGGLDMAVSQVTGAETVWVSDVDKGANKILSHRYPDVPNLGDITQVDFTTVEPVDILTGGFPCQDLSHAGKRAGMTTTRTIPAGQQACGCQWADHTETCQAASPKGDVPARLKGAARERAIRALNNDDRKHPDRNRPERVVRTATRSGLWSHMARAINELRPRLVVAENVRGLLSADAPGDVEPCPWCVGDGSTVNLRALGVVLADLADLGFDAEWVGLRCADIGGCHGRFRVFLIAYPNGQRPQWARNSRSGWQRPANCDCKSAVAALLPTPMAAEGTKPSNMMGVERRLETGQAFLTNVIVSLAGLDPTEQLLPTPASRDHKDTEGFTPHPEKRKLPHTIKGETFGDYAVAVERWENLTRPAPPPTELRPSGKGRLSPAFVEWMMGLPDGWVTGVPELSWAEQLKALGNGVVPQQAGAALTHLLGRGRCE